eukprot:gene24297-biopygen17907
MAGIPDSPGRKKKTWGKTRCSHNYAHAHAAPAPQQLPLRRVAAPLAILIAPRLVFKLPHALLVPGAVRPAGGREPVRHCGWDLPNSVPRITGTAGSPALAQSVFNHMTGRVDPAVQSASFGKAEPGHSTEVVDHNPLQKKKQRSRESCFYYRRQANLGGAEKLSAPHQTPALMWCCSSFGVEWGGGKRSGERG